MFCSISLFSTFFFIMIFFQTIAIYSKSILSDALATAWCSILKKCHHALAKHSSTEPFFKKAALGRLKVCNCRQTHFLNFHFCFFASFFHLGFLAANIADLCLTLTPFAYFWIWEPISWPTWEGLWRTPRSHPRWKKQYFLHDFIKNR